MTLAMDVLSKVIGISIGFGLAKGVHALYRTLKRRLHEISQRQIEKTSRVQETVVPEKYLTDPDYLEALKELGIEPPSQREPSPICSSSFMMPLITSDRISASSITARSLLASSAIMAPLPASERVRVQIEDSFPGSSLRPAIDFYREGYQDPVESYPGLGDDPEEKR